MNEKSFNVICAVQVILSLDKENVQQRKVCVYATRCDLCNSSYHVVKVKLIVT